MITRIVSQLVRATPFTVSSPMLALCGTALAFQWHAQLLPSVVTWCLVGLAAALLASRGMLPARTAVSRTLSHGALFLALAFAMLAYVAYMAQSGVRARLSTHLEGQNLLVEGFVAAMPLNFEQGRRYKFWVQGCDLRDCPVGQYLRLSKYDAFRKGPSVQPQESSALPVAEKLCLKVRLKRPLATLNPFGFDAELRAMEEGISATGSIRAVLDCSQLNGDILRSKVQWYDLPLPRLGAWIESKRAVLRDRLSESLDEGLSARKSDKLAKVAKATIIALVVGEQSAIPNTWWTIFNQTGVGHLMSISGLHITLFAGIVLAALKRLFRRPLLARWLLLLTLQPNRVSWLLAVFAAFSYSLIAGWGIPAQRTCWMLAVAAWALNTGRSKRMSSVLLAAAAMVCVMDPWAPLAAGFWLSFAAVAALVWFGGRQHLARQAWWHEAWRSQVAATLALTPMGAMFFASFSLVGPLANAFAIPFVSSLLTPYVLACSLLSVFWQSAAAWLLKPALWSTEWMLKALAWMANWTWASMTMAKPTMLALLLASLACVGLLAPFKLKHRFLYAFGLLPLVTAPIEAPRSDELWLTAFDVGQGMAILLETSERKLLYDAGPSYGSDSEAGSRVILPYLRARGVDHLDAVVVSHLDSDHSGGAFEVVKKTRPAWVASSIVNRTFSARHIECEAGQEWHWGDTTWKFLHPQAINTTAVKSTTNARSCVLHLKHPAVSVLLPGDLEKAQEKRLVDEYGEALAAEVLIAPHHGSSGSSSSVFLDAVSPKWAIFQVGYRNRFKHPSEKVLPRYEARGVEVLRSDHHAAIQMRFKVGEPPTILRWRQIDLPYWRLQAHELK